MATVIESPVPADSITNRPATQKSSLYHMCRSVLDGLSTVPGFECYLEDNDKSQPMDDSSIPLPPNLTNNHLDKLWHICRQGSSLCFLFNTLMPEAPIPLPLLHGSPSSPKATVKPKACVYHFIIACRDKLGFSEDSLFTVTELFQDDTNGFVKVVNTVSRILNLLNEKGCISLPSAQQQDTSSNAPQNMRDRVVAELRETERKYVQDLEHLQYYMREVQNQEVLTTDTLQRLFGNLNALVDFQRRFLIQVEENADRPPEEQRFGSLFINLESAFAVYEPFCANSQMAQDLVLQEADKLQKLSSIMSPTYELPSMLIKPVQRVCKYPLLIQELLKETPNDWTYYGEMEEGLKAIQRVASKVNETKRQQENSLIVQDLKRKVEHWKEPVENYGSLLLQDKFIVNRRDSDREMLVFLFEKTLLFCKTEKDASKKPSARSIKKKKKDGSLSISQYISVKMIAQVTDTSQQGQHMLRIIWSGNDSQSQGLESFNLQTYILKCRNAEILNQWENAINKLVQLEKHETKDQALSKIIPTTPIGHGKAVLSGFFRQENVAYVDFGNENEILPATKDRCLSDVHDRSQTQVVFDHQNENPSNYNDRFREKGLSTVSSRDNNNSTLKLQLPSPHHPVISHSSFAENTASGVPYESPLPISYPPSPAFSYPSSPAVSSSSSTESIVSRQNSHDQFLKESYVHYSPQESEFCDGNDLSASTAANYQRFRKQTSKDNIRQMASYIQGHSISLHHKESVKIKFTYENSIYAVLVPLHIEYPELIMRIERKIAKKLNGAVGLKYQDEDGDLITIRSSEDLQMGFESLGTKNMMNIIIARS